MAYPQIGLYIPVTSKTGGSTKHLQKTARVQAGIHMKTSQAYACCQDKRSDGVVQQLGQYQLLESYIDILKQDDLAGSFMFQSVQGISGHNNKPGLTVFKRLYVASSATKNAWDGALQIMVVDGTFLKGHIFDQVVLLAVTYDGNNNQILLPYANVTSETEDNWVWFRRQLEQDFPGSYVLVADYTKGIESHQFQGDIRNSGCMFARCFKHLSENAEKAMSGIKGRGDIAACIYKMGRARTKQEYERTLQDFQALHLEAAEWFDKRHHLFASYVFLENGFRRFGVTTNNACESSNNAILFCLRDIWLY